jgi:hypothetical protein
MSRFGAFEVRVGGEALRLDGFEADFGAPAGGEVVVEVADDRATVHVLGRREIADGSLACSVDGRRRAMVAMDLPFLRRMLAEAAPAGDGAPDADLEGMDRDALLAQARAMRAAIRAHRDASGHDLCWHHPAMWALLPEKVDPAIAVPPWPRFLRGCVRYRQSLDEQAPDAAVHDKEFDD